MKKTSKLNLTSVRVMDAAEMKNIIGRGTCAYKSPDGHVYRGLSKKEAMFMHANQIGANWCCDSCGSATWY